MRNLLLFMHKEQEHDTVLEPRRGGRITRCCQSFPPQTRKHILFSLRLNKQSVSCAAGFFLPLPSELSLKQCGWCWDIFPPCCCWSQFPLSVLVLLSDGDCGCKPVPLYVQQQTDGDQWRSCKTLSSDWILQTETIWDPWITLFTSTLLLGFESVCVCV